MGWMRIGLTADEQRIVQNERESHTDAVVRRRLWVLWLLHCGLKREQASINRSKRRSSGMVRIPFSAPTAPDSAPPVSELAAFPVESLK